MGHTKSACLVLGFGLAVLLFGQPQTKPAAANGIGCVVEETNR